MLISSFPSPASAGRGASAETDQQPEAFFENAISDEEDGAHAPTHKPASRFDRQSAGSIVMVGKSLVQKLDQNSASIKKILFIFVPLALALTSFSSAVMLIHYVKTSDVAPGGDLVGVGGGSPVVATRGSTETFDLSNPAWISNRRIEVGSPGPGETHCPVSVAEKIFADCEESISVHLKKQCRSGVTKIFSLCGAGGGSYSKEEDADADLQIYSYESMNAKVSVTCSLTRGGDGDTCAMEFESTAPSRKDMPCKCDYECETGFCDIETSTCKNYDIYLGGLNVTDDVANTTQSHLQSLLVKADALFTYDAFDDLKPFLQSSTATSCESLMGEFADHLDLSLEDMLSVQDYLFTPDHIVEIADFCDALEDGTEFAFLNGANSLVASELSLDDMSNLLKDIQDMASNGLLSSENAVEFLSMDNNFTSREMLEAIFENVDPLTFNMISNTFEEKQEQILQDVNDLLTPANPPEEHDNVFAGHTRFLLQDKYRSGPSLNEKIDALHKDHAERRALRVHQEYIENADRARQLITEHIDHANYHGRRLAAACDEDIFTCSSKQISSILDQVNEAFDPTVYDEIAESFEIYGGVVDVVDNTNLVLGVVHAGLFAAQFLPIVGPAFKVPESIVKKMKDFVNKLDKKLTDVEKKVVDKMDKALNVTVDKTIHFRNILDSTANNLGLLGGVVSTECNAQLIESITGIDLMSPSTESVADIASDGLHSVGKGMAGALQIVNSLTASLSWEVFQKLLSVAGDFTDLVNPLMDPLKPITELLQKEIRAPWIGSIYRKTNLGKVQCRSHQQVGYHSEKGTFGDLCWEKCEVGWETVPASVPPKCKPTCRKLHKSSKLNIIEGCTNENKYSEPREEKKKKATKTCKKLYGSSWSHIFGTKICRKDCPRGYEQSLKYCTKYNSCPSGFSGNKGNKFCKRNSSTKRSHSATCDMYGVPARIDISNNCMKKCLPGEGETPLGLCVKPGELVFSISDIVDLIAAFFEKVGKVIMAPIEKTIGFLIEKVLNPVLKSIGLPPFNPPTLPDIPLPALPAPPTLPDLAAITDIANKVETIVELPQKIINEVSDKIPSLPDLDLDEVGNEIQNVLSYPIAGIVDVLKENVLDAIGGCARYDTMEIPSMVSLMKTLEVDSSFGSSWEDCKIEVPICTELDLAPIHPKKMDEVKNMILDKLPNLHRRLSSSSATVIQIPLNVAGDAFVGAMSDDIYDVLYGKRGHFGTGASLLGKTHLYYDTGAKTDNWWKKVKTTDGSWVQTYFESEFFLAAYLEIRLEPTSDLVMSIFCDLRPEFRVSRLNSPQWDSTKKIWGNPLNFKLMLQTSLEQNKKMVNVLHEKTQVRLGFFTTEEVEDCDEYDRILGIPCDNKKTVTKPWVCDECFDCFTSTVSDEIVPTEKCVGEKQILDNNRVAVNCLSKSQYDFCQTARDLYTALNTGMSDRGGCDVNQLNLLISRIEDRPSNDEALFWNTKSSKGWQDNIFGESAKGGGGVDVAKVCSGELNKIYTKTRQYTDTRESALSGENAFGDFQKDLKNYLTKERKYSLHYSGDLVTKPLGEKLKSSIKEAALSYAYTLKLSSFSTGAFGGYDKFNHATRRWNRTDTPIRYLFGFGLSSSSFDVDWNIKWDKEGMVKKILNAFSKVAMFFKNQHHELSFWLTYPQNGKKTDLADIHIGKFAPFRRGYASSSFKVATQFHFSPVRAQFYIPLYSTNSTGTS